MDLFGLESQRYADQYFPLTIMRNKRSGSAQIMHRWHEDLEIKLVRSAPCTVLVETEVLDLNKDDICFINPYQMHSTVPSFTDLECYDLITLPLDFFQIVGNSSMHLRSIFNQKNIRIRNHIRNGKLSAILQHIISAYEEDTPYRDTYLEGLLLSFFSILLQEEIDVDSRVTFDSDRIRYHAVIEPALEAIHNRYSDKLTNEELAKLCAMNVCYFCHIFKRVVGITPIQYLTDYRMRVADILLKNSNESVGTIARMVGIYDEAYFCRCYKRYKGITPTSYRHFTRLALSSGTEDNISEGNLL